MKSFIFFPLSLLILAACGGRHHYDDNNDSVQAEEPAPSEEEDSYRFTVRCRLATAIAGSNFQYEWSNQTIENLLEFDTARNRVRVGSSNGAPSTNSVDYTVALPEDGTVGSQGTINYNGLSLFFPVIPYGTIQGSTQQYLIGTLNRSETQLGIYLCGRSLQNEFTMTNP